MVNTQIDERQLLQLAMHGDGASLDELFRRWQGKIYRFILRQTRNREDAQDLTQNTFAKAFDKLHTLSDASSFAPWLYKIALNECRMGFRKAARVQSVPIQEENSQTGQVLEWGREDPETAVLERERTERLSRAFEQLPDEQRTVILMKEFHDLKFHEIAQIVDAPLSTVKSRMYLGLKTLRQLMEKADEV